ncbi:MAG: type II secretion system protein [Planctomycetes bacterium]|nr:type II secretion system protein [Planctomycetota bacterium]
MTTRPLAARPVRGFTLVELITVVAILGILVTLTVGAVEGVRNYNSRRATLELFSVLDAALQKYYDDWGKYPYDLSSVPNTEYAQVLVSEVVGTTTTYPFLPLQAKDAVITYPDKPQEKRDAMFYAAMTMTRRNGPYFRGGATVVQARKTSDGKVYYVFVDGWGRKVTYTAPTSVPTGQPPAPILRSLGANEFKDDDDLYNYRTP